MDDIDIFGKTDFDAKKYINYLCEKRSDEVPVEKCVYDRLCSRFHWLNLFVKSGIRFNQPRGNILNTLSDVMTR